MKLFIILAFPLLMDAVDPGIVDGVENSGSICDSFDEDGNHNCGDGVHDTMYIQKKGRSIVSSHGHVKKNVQAPALPQGVKFIHGVPVYGYDKATIANPPSGQKPVALVQDADQADWIISFGVGASDLQLEDFCTNIAQMGAVCVGHGGHPSEGGLPFDYLRASQSQLSKILEKYPNLAYAEHDDQIELDDPEDPLDDPPSFVQSGHSSVPWGLDRIDSQGIDNSYTSPGAGGAGVHVYVLDTGVRTTHAEFEGRAIPTLESLATFKVCAAHDTSCASDTHGHGTHCSGTVAGKTKGVATEATIHAVKVLDPSGYTSWITKAMDWVITKGERPAIISMSLGGPGVSAAYREAVDDAVAAGVTVVVAAGNSNSDACNFSPAFVPSGITVGSTTVQDQMSYFSNYGQCVDIFAPGSSISSAGKSSDVAETTMSGTSMACPHVAGAAAILLSESPGSTPHDILSALLSKATLHAIGGLGPDSPNKLLAVVEAQSCSRPSGWCSHGGSTYQEVDCDGDGIADPYCKDSSNSGFQGSASGCTDTWPNGICQASCNLDSASWDAGWGPCSTYAAGQKNRNYCNLDSKNGYYADQVCPQCGKCQAPQYVETAYGSADCPSSYKSITDESTCRQAQSSLGKNWGHASSWGHIQGGCFSHANKNVWYNTNAGGSTHSIFSSICEEA